MSERVRAFLKQMEQTMISNMVGVFGNHGLVNAETGIEMLGWE